MSHKSKSGFVHESYVYRLLLDHGIKAPKFFSVVNETDVEKLPFREGEPIVVKGLGDNLWHKSDEGALHFFPYEKNKVLELHKSMKERLNSKYPWIETMVCSRVNFKTASGLPTEGFVSIKHDDACGVIISFGLGGIHAEAWAQELGGGVMMWSPELTSPKEAFSEIRAHWLGKVWMGELRQGKRLVDNDKLLDFLNGLWAIAHKMTELKLELLEMNPVVVDEDGSPIALDGVGSFMAEVPKAPIGVQVSAECLLNPRSVAIAGVSEKAGNFGRRILENLIASSHSGNGVKELKVIKPGAQEFLGVPCYPDIKVLKDAPVDALVLALPAALTVKTVTDLCEQGGGAQIVYLVAGGIGDGGDKSGLGKQMNELLASRRAKGLWTPALIGPNSLGIVLSPKKLSTLFISQEKLPIHYSEKGNVGFVSQSGAFFITRLSKERNLPIKYGFCIGNQMDLKISDFLNLMGSDQHLNVMACYVEGFSNGEVLRFAQTAKKLIAQGKHVVLYRGGRSEEGMKAAAGHTGAMAGNYELQKKIIAKSGVYTTESFAEFSSVLAMLSSYPNYSQAKKVAVISNAGFETVSSADNLGSMRKEKRQNRMMPMNDDLKEKLTEVFKANGLSELVGAANPLDLTPMADEKAYLESLEVFSRSEADAIVFCAVPLTDRFNSKEKAAVEAFAKRVREIALETGKSVLVAVDAGSIYDEYRRIFKETGLPVFVSIEEAFAALKYERT